MKRYFAPLRWLGAVALVLLVASAAGANSFCPATLDPMAYAYGNCYGCIGTYGAIASCPVIELGNGSLGCSCQNPNVPVQCGDPNIKRCGGILPQCNALDICDLNASTTCWDAHVLTMPAYASGCYFPPGDLFAGLVDPTKCYCETTVVKLPKSAAQKAAYQSCSTLMGKWSTLAYALSFIKWTRPAMIFVSGALSTIFGAEGVRCTALGNDPPRNDFTVVTVPFCADPGYAATVADGWTPDEASALNQVLTDAGCLIGASKRVLLAMERYEGAGNAASPFWMGVQKTEWTQAALAQQAAIQNLKLSLSILTDPARWDAATIANWSQIVNATDLATLNQFKKANLVPLP